MEESSDDATVAALRALVAQLQQSIDELHTAADRAEQLIGLRTEGRSWYEIVSAEKRPLVVEMISKVLDDLGEVGGQFRRQEALALRRERVSVTRISELFGVSRQRVSALVQERDRE